ncbi:hypothetical protein HG531_006565 [Fusarium graminearum]|nr:hypothetical protein HG531_006565 [Fusarium graminearum]
MILILLQSAHDNDCYNSLNASNTNRDGSAVDSVVALVGVGDSILCSESSLIALELVVHKPGAATESKDCVSLAADPLLIVRRRARSNHGLEDNLGSVCKSN